MAYQLCMRDEYGQSSVLATDDDLNEVIKICKQKLQSSNVDNSLTIDDKKRNWESFMVEVVINDEDQYEGYNLVYAGKDGRGIDQVFNDNNEIIKLSEVNSDITLKMFLGVLDSENWFAAVPSRTVRGEEDLVDSLTHQSLQGKDVYFIKPVEA